MYQSMRSRLAAAFLAVLMLFTLLGPSAFGATTPPYLYNIADGNIIISRGTTANTLKVQYGTNTQDNIDNSATPITLEGTSTTNTIVINGSGITNPIKIKLSNLNVDVSAVSANTCAFSIENNAIVEMDIDGTNYIESGYTDAGIRVSSTEQLTITGSGTLTAASGDFSSSPTPADGHGAGIGGDSGPNGKIVINCTGTVNANSVNGAGIGSGYGTSGAGGTATDITVENGTVNANSVWGAGIGSGASASSKGGQTVSTVIKKGNVTATSKYGAGIGAGASKTGAGGDFSAVTISGGFITAISEKGAGIGGGYGITEGGIAGSFQISGGTITAKSQDGAGIGGGSAESGTGGSAFQYGTMFYGATVDATSVRGAGVGGGYGPTKNGEGYYGSLNSSTLTRTKLGTSTDTNFTGTGTEKHKVNFLIQDQGGSPLSGVTATLRKPATASTPPTTEADGKTSFTLDKPSSPQGQNGTDDYTFDFELAGYQPAEYDCIDITKVGSGDIVITMTADSVSTVPPFAKASPVARPVPAATDITVSLSYYYGTGDPIPSNATTSKLTRYQWSQEKIPSPSYTNWAGTPVTQTQDGTWYLHYMVSDPDYNGGQWVKGYFGPYRKNTPPPPSSDCEIISFDIGYSGKTYSGQINGLNITVNVPSTVNTAAMDIPEVGIVGNNYTPPAQTDFSNPVSYTVTADDMNTTKVYTVYVNKVNPPVVGKGRITRFSAAGRDATILGAYIYLTVPQGTDLAALNPTITAIDTITTQVVDFSAFPTELSVQLGSNTGTATAYKVYVSVESEPHVITPPSVTPASNTNLAPGGTSSSAVNLGMIDNVPDDTIAMRADILIDNTNAISIDKASLTQNGNFIVTAKSPGQSRVIVKFFAPNGFELYDYRKTFTVTVAEPSPGGGGDSGNSGTGGGSQTSLYIDEEGFKDDVTKIDTTKDIYVIDVAPGVDGDATVTIPHAAFTYLKNKKSDFHLMIRTDFGMIDVPVNYYELITGLDDILAKNNLTLGDLYYRINLKDASNDPTAKTKVATALPGATLTGPILDVRLDLLTAKSKNVVATITNFTKFVDKYIPIKDSPFNDVGAFHIDGTAEFRAHLFANFDGKKYIRIMSNSNSLYVAVDNPLRFSDVGQNAWYALVVDRASSKGLVRGMGDGTFVPAAPITRAEFVQMMVNAMNPAPLQSGANPYSDVTAKDWYYSAVSRAKAAGYLTKFTGETFLPNQAMSREEMASVLAYALRSCGYKNSDSDSSAYLSKIFTDVQSISAQYRDDVALVHQSRVMEGIGQGLFDPKGNAERAQSAAVQIRMLETLVYIDKAAK